MSASTDIVYYGFDIPALPDSPLHCSSAGQTR
ncbi:hypothetical protein CGRA01v4_09016 [Colletotrichum graminicola]|nr:hypothetical protein CGRA01v4_09016 [Colletotrichum graminicola]